nr:sulfotransferase [Mesorhizobium sophorae]
MSRNVFGTRPHDRANAIAAYGANVRAVIATIPSGQLLVHNLGDEWGPLCLHLGVPVPDHSYPNRNNPNDLQSALAHRTS